MPIPTEHTQLKPFVHPALNKCEYIFHRHDAVKKPLQPNYDGPFRDISRYDKNFEIETPNGKQRVSINRVKPVFILAEDSIPVSPREMVIRDDVNTPQVRTRSGRKAAIPRRFLCSLKYQC